MSARRRLWWSVYALCALAACGALVWASHVALRLERSESRARVDVEHAQTLRLALWRMDSWLAPILAAEAARPADVYEPYQRTEAYSAWRASPLLDYRTRYVRLHFEVRPDGSVISPQSPTGDDRALALAAGLPATYLDANFACVEELRPRLDYAALHARVNALAARVADVMREELEDPESAETPPSGADFQAQRLSLAIGARNGIARRQSIGQNARQAVENCGPLTAPGAPRVGPFVGVWLGGGDTRVLAFVRTVDAERGSSLQGFLTDWRALSEGALAQVQDLVPGARLVPVQEERSADDTTGRVLAMLPAELSVAAPPSPVAPDGPLRPALAIVWAAALLALVAGAVTLRATIAYGERRSRFASAVTHELRTPLTTFRMYAEMLADGLVTDPQAQREYLQTLRGESERLSSVVENVLAYARLEQGRADARIERLPLRDVAERLVPRLERRAADSDVALHVDVRGPAGDPLRVDVEALGQILLNLVDNACKYGASSGAPRVDLVLEALPGRLRASVADRGPGIPRALRERVFAPFDRGARDEGSVPGVGLGLALSRGLARRLRGDVTLDADHAPGARFVVDLPA